MNPDTFNNNNNDEVGDENNWIILQAKKTKFFELKWTENLIKTSSFINDVVVRCKLYTAAAAATATVKESNLNSSKLMETSFDVNKPSKIIHLGDFCCWWWWWWWCWWISPHKLKHSDYLRCKNANTKRIWDVKWWQAKWFRFAMEMRCSMCLKNMKQKRTSGG